MLEPYRREVSEALPKDDEGHAMSLDAEGRNEEESSKSTGGDAVGNEDAHAAAAGRAKVLKRLVAMMKAKEAEIRELDDKISRLAIEEEITTSESGRVDSSDGPHPQEHRLEETWERVETALKAEIARLKGLDKRSFEAGAGIDVATEEPCDSMSECDSANGSDPDMQKRKKTCDAVDAALEAEIARLYEEYDRSQNASSASKAKAATEGMGGTGGDTHTGAQTEADLQKELNSLYPGDRQTSLEGNSTGTV
jgi:hypothetical protein